MSDMKHTAGRRLPDGNDVALMQPGDYMLSGSGAWWVCCPVEDALAAPLSSFRWSLVVGADGSLTAHPSINYHPSLIRGVQRQGWHGWLQQGVWKEIV